MIYSEKLLSKSSLSTACIRWRRHAACYSRWRLGFLPVSLDIEHKQLGTSEKSPDLPVREEILLHEGFSVQQQFWQKYHWKPHSISIFVEKSAYRGQPTETLIHDSSI